MDEYEAGRLLSEESIPDRRLRYFSALLARESGLGTEGMTVVGGSAIEIYTRGEYVSNDLDLVVDSRSAVVRVLKRWGFRDEGRGWSKKAWKLFVDVMERRDTGSRRLTQIVSTPIGPFRVSGIEDLIVRRIRESVAWPGREEAFAQAILLAQRAETELDWDYVKFYAMREGWESQLEDLLRLARTARVARRRGSDPG